MNTCVWSWQTPEPSAKASAALLPAWVSPGLNGIFLSTAAASSARPVGEPARRRKRSANAASALSARVSAVGRVKTSGESGAGSAPSS
jgi:hypothetical protein